MTAQHGQACSVVLGSWRQLQKHLFQHCSLSQSLTCGLPRCNIRTHSSRKGLTEHINLSHLSKILIDCPIKGCNTHGFSRVTQLENHFEENHNDLNGKFVALPSILLQPLAQPFFPSMQVDPPSLPENICIAASLIPPPRFVSCKALTTKPSNLSSAKYEHFGLESTSKSKSVESSTEYNSLEMYFQGKELGQEMVYAKLQAGFAKDLARPQSMRHDLPTKNRDPPMSILYEAFAIRMEGLEGKGKELK